MHLISQRPPVPIKIFKKPALKRVLAFHHLLQRPLVTCGDWFNLFMNLLRSYTNRLQKTTFQLFKPFWVSSSIAGIHSIISYNTPDVETNLKTPHLSKSTKPLRLQEGPKEQTYIQQSGKNALMLACYLYWKLTLYKNCLV